MPGRGPDRAASGDRGPALTAEEFAARFEDASRVLWTVAAGVLGSPSEAEDVLQEACVMALGKLEQYRRGTSFAAWMTTFVRNVARNHARKRGRRATTPTEPEVLAELAGGTAAGPPAGAGPGPVEPDGSLASDQRDFDDAVVAGLEGLAGVARAALLLRTVLDLSYREIAATLGVPEGTAMSHVHRARVALRERLLGAPEPLRAAMEERRA